MRVLIADKLDKVRSALRLLIEQELDGEVVAEAASASDLLPQLRSSCPDLLLLEWDLPGLEGKERIARIRDCCPDLVVAAVRSQGSVGGEREFPGADAVISKGDSPDRVLAVLRSFRQLEEILPGDAK